MPVYTASETTKTKKDVEFEKDLFNQIFSFEAIKNQLDEERKLKKEKQNV